MQRAHDFIPCRSQTNKQKHTPQHSPTVGHTSTLSLTRTGTRTSHLAEINPRLQVHSRGKHLQHPVWDIGAGVISSRLSERALRFT